MRYWEIDQNQRIFVIIPKPKSTKVIIHLLAQLERMKFYIITALLFLAFLSAPAQSDTVVEIGVVENLDQYIPLDAMLIDENGDSMVIGDLLDKPTILNFVYYRCPGICSPLMDGLADAMDGNDLVLGEDYQALTISFDAREGTFLAIKKKNNYLNLMEKKEQAEKGWLFYTSYSAIIAQLT